MIEQTVNMIAWLGKIENAIVEQWETMEISKHVQLYDTDPQRNPTSAEYKLGYSDEMSNTPMICRIVNQCSIMWVQFSIGSTVFLTTRPEAGDDISIWIDNTAIAVCKVLDAAAKRYTFSDKE